MNYLSSVWARFASVYAVLLSVVDKIVSKPVMMFVSAWVVLLVVLLAPIPSMAFQVEEPETTENGCFISFLSGLSCQFYYE